MNKQVPSAPAERSVLGISSQLALVRQQIAQAAASAGRAPDSVALLAVSKTFGADAVIEAVRAGQSAFGENYIQEGVEKITACRARPDCGDLVWHCIGPLQSNKTRQVAEHFDWVHSVDRLKIAQRLSEQRPAHLPPLQVCLQVNIDGGPTKAGVAPADALALAQAVAALPRLVLRGVMTIPDAVEGFDAQLAVHTQAKRLFDDLQTALCLPHFAPALTVAALAGAIPNNETTIRTANILRILKY